MRQPRRGQERVTCPFCDVSRSRVVASNGAALAIRDNFPVACGHTLIVPRRHCPSVFGLGAREEAGVWALVRRVRARLAKQLRPDAFTVGVNDGEAAGQTVAHGHVHVIPRWRGDVADPRGGLRWVIPSKAPY